NALLNRRGTEHVCVSGANQCGAFRKGCVAGDDSDGPQFIIATIAGSFAVVDRGQKLASFLRFALMVMTSRQHLAPVCNPRANLALETSFYRLIVGTTDQVIRQVLLFDDRVFEIVGIAILLAIPQLFHELGR